jgi:RNA polymerase sigma factor (TIGR02999 family)
MSNEINNNLTVLLNRWTNGDKSIETSLINEIYPMLHEITQKQLNRHSYNHTFETTDVVHEAFIKLKNQNAIDWKNRNQFFAISAQIIRRLLIDDYRSKKSKKRGKMLDKLTIDGLSSIIIGEIDIDFDLLEFDNLLTKLGQLDKQAAKVVELRFYVGLTNEETAEICDVTLSNVKSNWNFARSWLLNQLTE